MGRTKKKKGLFLRALSGLYGSSHVREIVKSLANDQLRSQRREGPPYNPFECARSLGLDIEYANVEAEGIFVDDPRSRPRIILRKLEEESSASQRRRQNFTLAHELGHFVIRQALADFVPASAIKLRSGNIEEEQICNAFAAEILMPTATFRHEVKRTGLHPEEILALSDLYDVSLQSLLCRVRDFIPGNIVSVIWSKIDGRIRVDWATTAHFRQIVLRNTGNTTVERALESYQVEVGRDYFLLRGKSMWRECASKRLPSGTKVLTIMGQQPFSFLRALEPPISTIPPVKKVMIQQQLQLFR